MEVSKGKSKLILLRKDLKDLIFCHLNIYDHFRIGKTCSLIRDHLKLKIKTLKIVKIVKESHLQELIDNTDVYIDKYEKFYGIKEKDFLEAIAIRIMSIIDSYSSCNKELYIKISILKHWNVIKASLDCLSQTLFQRESSIILILNPQIYKAFLKTKIHEISPHIKGIKFYENSLDEEGLILLNAFLKDNKNIRSIFLEKNNLNEKACHQLIEIVKNTEVLQSLYISKIGITEVMSKKIFNELKFNKTIRKVYFSHNSLDKNSIEAIADVLCTNVTLSLLDLSSVQLLDEGLAIISEAMKKNLSIRSLSLSNNNITSIGLINLTECLKNNNTLTSFDISENKINYKGIKFLMKSLKDTKINKLSLSKCDLNRKVFKFFFDYLKTINLLNLSGNDLEHDSCTLLYYFLKDEANGSLQTLILNQCNIDTTGLFWICSGMKKNKTLKTLRLSSNNFADEGAKNISIFLEKNKTLIELDLSHNRITDDGLKTIFLSITGRSYLKLLNISSNVFSDLTSTSIAEFLFNRSRLKILIMKTTLIRDDYYKYIIDAANLNTYLEKLVIQVRLKNNFAKLKKIEFEM